MYREILVSKPAENKAKKKKQGPQNVVLGLVKQDFNIANERDRKQPYCVWCLVLQRRNRYDLSWYAYQQHPHIHWQNMKHILMTLKRLREALNMGYMCCRGLQMSPKYQSSSVSERQNSGSGTRGIQGWRKLSDIHTDTQIIFWATYSGSPLGPLFCQRPSCKFWVFPGGPNVTESNRNLTYSTVTYTETSIIHILTPLHPTHGFICLILIIYTVQ